MSAAMFFQAWGDTLVTTAALVLVILLIRKPFARHFGPGLTYALWVVPALRLLLPPLPFAQPDAVPVAASAVPASAEPAVELVMLAPVDSVAAVPATPAVPLLSLAELMPILFALWAAGMVAVLVAAMVSHHRFRRSVLTGAVTLEPIGTIRLVMTEAVDGPVAFGLWRRYVAVPQDFFARYVAEERALAIDHELAHHRHGDLWANAAALLLLSVQWFNPFAWRAIRAFRFDQEAACDARVLALADSAPRNVRTARYATAIAKAAVGSRLSLAAPMAVHDNLQERLTMLMQQDISKKRGLVGRLLVGGATLAVLATTATLVP
ncbi:M56 family metallopeptidase, partial [Sphingopyxis sp. KK2]|uniref:M56 family metallopeptidase n=1 Tax=Sphingopyxis sp. KK2 TaxID=1855727 RepID=UPI001C4DDC34